MVEETGFKKWAPLFVMGLALYIVVLDTTVINVSIKAIIQDLHSNLKAVQWVITGYSLMLAAFTITSGRLGDIFGCKRLFLIGGYRVRCRLAAGQSGAFSDVAYGERLGRAR